MSCKLIHKQIEKHERYLLNCNNVLSMLKPLYMLLAWCKRGELLPTQIYAKLCSNVAKHVQNHDVIMRVRIAEKCSSQLHMTMCTLCNVFFNIRISLLDPMQYNLAEIHTAHAHIGNTQNMQTYTKHGQHVTTCSSILGSSCFIDATLQKHINKNKCFSTRESTNIINNTLPTPLQTFNLIQHRQFCLPKYLFLASAPGSSSIQFKFGTTLKTQAEFKQLLHKSRCAAAAKSLIEV